MRATLRAVGPTTLLLDGLPTGGLASSSPDPEAMVTERATRATTVYECPSCETRFLGEQRCPDCGIFCGRIGPGGLCPHCDEPVALADLLLTHERR
ncbi:MAG: hypothetical protein HY534_06045 [Chloroflexi bacterium]|nr:hypothetical protein [Chloroflexota bacterium]